jgi:hypothetical protein
VPPGKEATPPRSRMDATTMRVEFATCADCPVMTRATGDAGSALTDVRRDASPSGATARDYSITPRLSTIFAPARSAGASTAARTSDGT